jgi:hypothetical protein
MSRNDFLLCLSIRFYARETPASTIQNVLRIKSSFRHNNQVDVVCLEFTDSAKTKILSHSSSVIEPDFDLLSEVAGADLFGSMANDQMSDFVGEHASNFGQLFCTGGDILASC